MLAVAGKDGYVLGIDRTTKQVVFKTAGTTTANTGPVDETLQLVSPGTWGGAQWNGTAYHPGMNIVYTGMVDWPTYYSTNDYSDDPGFWLSIGWEDTKGTVRQDFSKRASGWITAMDLDRQGLVEIPCRWTSAGGSGADQEWTPLAALTVPRGTP